MLGEVVTLAASRSVAEDGGSAIPPAVQGLSSVEDVLRRETSLSDDSIARALLIEQETGEPLDTIITRLGLLSEDALVAAFCRATGLAQVRAEAFPASAIAIGEVSPAFLRDRRVLPLAMDASAVSLAIVNPLDSFAVQGIEFATNLSVRCFVARGSDIDAAIDRLYRGEDRPDAAIEEVIDEDDLERMKDLVSDAPVIRAVNRLIAHAVDARASDIHVEPSEDNLGVRFRIDGVLQEMPPLPAAMRSPLVSRIKVMADLNIAERRLPQDGRLRVAVRGHDIDLRVATAPSIHGESVVMRILDRSKLALDLSSLGFDKALAAEFKQAVHRPHGIVLVTGPTGSGKTTTLYAALAELNSHERKLLTVEDPIEYRLPGIVQTQVNPGIGFTFSNALRSFLRQDPDVMMVGEIRDTETAQIAVQAALTGHMILSTLHTNTAAGAVTRLVDMGVEPFLLSSVLTAVVAQRLVRRLCVSCREPYMLEGKALTAIDPRLSKKKPLTLYRPAGCDRCGHSGYAGRVALFEFLNINERIAALVLRRADAREIEDAAFEQGMRTLRSDGLAKAREGLTTLDEVLRVSVGD